MCDGKHGCTQSTVGNPARTAIFNRAPCKPVPGRLVLVDNDHGLAPVPLVVRRASVLRDRVAEFPSVSYLQVVPGHERERLPLVSAAGVVVGHRAQAVVSDLLLGLQVGIILIIICCIAHAVK